MKRPSIKDQKILAYVEYLEHELATYDVDTSISNFLVAIRKQMDRMSVLMGRMELDETSIISNNDKTFDRVYKLLEKAPQLINTMIDAQKHIKQNSVARSGSKELESAGFMEKALKNKNA